MDVMAYMVVESLHPDIRNWSSQGMLSGSGDVIVVGNVYGSGSLSWNICDAMEVPQ